MAYATVDQVASGFRPLTTEEQSVCATLLNEAAIIIDAYNASASADIKQVVSCRMCRRAIGAGDASVPMGATQGSMTAGPYSQSWTMSNGSTGELYLGRTEKSLLGGNSAPSSNSPSSSASLGGTLLDTLLKERDVAQLDGYSVHSSGAANHMDLLVQYAGGEQIAATGLPPHNNKNYNAEWFIDFFRSLSGAFGKNIFTDAFKEKELAERKVAMEAWKKAVSSSAGNAAAQSNNSTSQGNNAPAQNNPVAADGSWQCECGQMNFGPFCSECGRVRPKA